ncbi:MAG: alkaline phosphatase family protein [Verrucomicrobiae bacterium]|nr:alkaline phosphatase family protein [Verrucomicrobiae bacterium]
MRFLSMCLVLAASAAICPGQTNLTLWPGRQPDGSMLLPNQWSLRPAGSQQIDLGDFPVNIALTPDGRYAAVLHCGYGHHEVELVDLNKGVVTCRTNVAEAFYGLTFSSDGRKLYCSGASGEDIHVFRFHDGQLQGAGILRLRKATDTGVPCGLAINPSGKILYAADLWSSRISCLDLTTKSVCDVALDTNEAPAMLAPQKGADDFDSRAATKRARAAEMSKHGEVAGAFPYACVLDAKRNRLYVSLWGAAKVAVLDTKATNIIARWDAGQHPCEMVLTRDGRRLFVANANDNTVSVLDTATGRAMETLWATSYPDSPRGATPNSVALSPDEKTLFVANANINAIAVFDVSDPGHGSSLGFIPSGWYPTCVRVTPDGKKLLITNGKGNTALANPDGPEPIPGRTKKEGAQYIAGLLKGTLSVVDLPAKNDFSRQMAAWTADVLKCTPLRPDASVVTQRPAGNPVPQQPGESGPITHCIYIIKENRTYDQVFGDKPEGNGDPKLCLFPERVTPNLHKLTSQFVLLDNFYADAEVSADGHEWSMAAYASDFAEKTWPLNYGHKKSKFPYPSEGVFPIASPASGYLWDQAAAAGVSYRSYGEFVQNGTTTNDPVTTKLKALQGHFDPGFNSFALEYPDAARAERFISEMHRFEREGDMPHLQIVRLPNDHTHGVTAGQRTPTAYVAENDAALGKLVQAVSESKFWTNTAIFVVEDDAQNGSDHVDAHRTEALVISPYTKHGAVDSTLYSTTSMLRTMELILGLKPMTQFDAAATPMFNSFQPVADASPYRALPAKVDVHETNSLAAWGAKEKFNFAKEDANDDLKFGEVVWRSVKGADSPMPAPVHAGFVMATKSTDEDD